MAQTEKGEWGHQSVLLQEVIAMLDIQSGDIFLDGTLGSGGHSEEIVKRYGAKVKIVGLDADANAIERSRKRLTAYEGDVTLVQDNFRNLGNVLESLNLRTVDKILLDLGMSSNQLEQSGRGFSFQKDEPLQMTFKEQPDERDLTAYTILNEWAEDSIEAILKGFGGERYARRIASQIIQARARMPITTTHELVRIIEQATPRAYHRQGINPATKTFQALRIAVNDELGALQEGLKQGFKYLAPQGRLAVISFHSLEDRIVKNFFRDLAKEGSAVLLSKKPVVPARAEVIANRRSRSAKLRILMKV
jgi:16S rRNA (cytosine1402-N4)-methyltransferase